MHLGLFCIKSGRVRVRGQIERPVFELATTTQSPQKEKIVTLFSQTVWYYNMEIKRLCTLYLLFIHCRQYVRESLVSWYQLFPAICDLSIYICFSRPSKIYFVWISSPCAHSFIQLLTYGICNRVNLSCSYRCMVLLLIELYNWLNHGFPMSMGANLLDGLSLYVVFSIYNCAL